MGRTCWSLLIVCVVLLNMLLCIYGENKPEVNTKLGKIVGSVMKTRSGKDIYAFRNIKYAKPPVGDRRFKAPEPVDAWQNTYDATQEGPKCIQLWSDGNEDCLILNVYTTQIPSSGHAIEKPVIAYIHGGGLRYGASKSTEFGPQYLLDKDVVLVTFNYRLGPLGFTATGDKHAPGNYGLKDQNLALKFIRDHIAAFGGNPNSVTLAGQSAGSQSVMLHVTSPMSKGLFHRAIAMSGPAQPLESYPNDQKDVAVKLAKLLNCDTQDNEKMIACLRKVPAASFGTIQNKVWDWRGEPVWLWNAVIEPNIPGLERFLTDQPNNLAKSGNFNQVPLITGVTRDELGYETIKIVEAAKKGDNSMFDTFNNKWDEIAPVRFFYQSDSTKSKHVSSELKKFYFKNQPISLKNADKLAHLITDTVITYPLRRSALLMAKSSKQPVYFYLFNYEGPYTYNKWSDGKPFGVSHTDDTFYPFYHQGYPMVKTTDKENRIVEGMTTIWANFAKTGKPIPNNNARFKGIKWDKLNPQKLNYLEINLNPQMKENFFASRMKFWEKLYPA